MTVTRRGFMGGFFGCVAGQALANAPLSSPRPETRAGFSKASMPVVTRPAGALIEAAALGGEVTYVVADARTGLILEARQGDYPMPPASTAKAITALYALEHLGAGQRFETRLIATGPVEGGTVRGDLVLAGGGDPTLSTDDLGDLARALAATGIKGISGRFRVWSGALPYIEAIDRTQPEWLGYNPAVSGLNLNFNRVNFVWKRAGSGYEVGMDARAERFAPKVYSARVTISERDLPVYTYKNGGHIEEWSVSRRALGRGGSRWLPVRRPDLYAGDVFQTLARAEGVPLPAPEATDRLPGGTIVATHRSSDLRPILRDMLKYSTNMTAEAIGMAASARRGVDSHVGSGRAMTDWLKERTGATSARFADHSGLAGASRISAADMVATLVKLGPQAGLPGLMKDIPFRDANGKKMSKPPAQVLAKTGTLNFVSTLAGYITVPGETELAFAIFTGDVARRDAVPDAQRENPEGVRGWVKRSKRLQQELIERWVAVYGA